MGRVKASRAPPRTEPLWMSGILRPTSHKNFTTFQIGAVLQFLGPFWPKSRFLRFFRVRGVEKLSLAHAKFFFDRRFKIFAASRHGFWSKGKKSVRKTGVSV